MKLKKLLALTLTSMLVLSGCASNQGGSSSSKNEKLTNAQIMEKIEQSSKELKSMKSDMKMKQNIKIKDQMIDTNSKINMELIQDPLKIHMNMDITAPQSPTVKTEIYIIDNSMYMKSDQTGGKFQKMDLSGSGININSLKDMANNMEQTEYMKKLTDKLKVEDKGSVYEVSYSGDGKEIIEMIKSSPAFANNPMLKPEDMNIKKFNFKSTYNKETFFLESSVTEMIMTIKTPEGDMEMSQNMDMKVTENNSVKEINLPADVK